MPPWRGHVIRYLLTSITIELVPLVVAEGTFIYVRMSRVKKQTKHDILAPCVPFVEGPYMSKALRFQVGCQHGRAPQPSATLQ